MLRIRDRIRRLEAQRPTPPTEKPRFTPRELKLLQADPEICSLGKRKDRIWRVAEQRYRCSDGRIKPSMSVAYRDAVLHATTDDELRQLQVLVGEIEARIANVLGAIGGHACSNASGNG